MGEPLGAKAHDKVHQSICIITELEHLKQVFNDAPALVKSHFTNIMDSVFLLSFHSLKDGNDIEYIKLIEQIFDCLLKIHQAGLNNFIIEPTAEETDSKYQAYLAKQAELCELTKQLFYYSKWNEFTK